MLCGLLAGLMLSVAQAAPQRVASINLCADVLLLNLLPRERIASVSWLAAVSPLSAVREQAAGISTNHATLEELLLLKPDLVVARRGHAASVLRQMRSRGVAVHEIEVAPTLAQAMREWQALADVLGVSDKAGSLLVRAQQRLAALPPRAGKPPTAVIFGPGGYSYGKGSMAHDLLRLAGWDNLAAYVLPGAGGTLPLEALVLGQPDLLIHEASEQDRRINTLGRQIAAHPVLHGRSPAELTMSSSAWACGGPEAIEAVELLAAQRRQAGVP